MTPNQLVCELEHATCELLTAADGDLDRVQKLLECRAAVLARIAACAPSAFAPNELSRLRAAAHNGEAVLEKLTFLRRGAASGLHRLNHLNAPANEAAKNTILFSG